MPVLPVTKDDNAAVNIVVWHDSPPEKPHVAPTRKGMVLPRLVMICKNGTNTRAESVNLLHFLFQVGLAHDLLPGMRERM